MFEWFIKRQLWQNWSHPSPLPPCSGICEKVKPPPPNGSSCSACFLKFMSWQHVRAWQGSVELCLASRESANMENHLVNLHVFVFGRRQYFFLFSLLFLSFLPVTVLVLFWYPFHTLFCTSSFLSLVTPSHFFCLTLTVWFSSFFHTFDTIHCMCPPPPLYFLCLFLFLSPKLFPFHSIGTREVVTQKNLSGLVPIRDLRLDPSLLCSIPLLALSPNLLIVWLFLSIAYLVTKLRCK